MKKLFSLILILSLLFLCACSNKTSVGVIGGADGPTTMQVSNNNESYVKRGVRLIRADGEIYYDTGKLSTIDARCGTLDSALKKTVTEFEVPLNDGECNFDGADGYQSVTSITKEIPMENGWLVFKKLDVPKKDLKKYKYCYYLKGTMPNAAKESELIVLTNDFDLAIGVLSEHASKP